MPSYYTVVQYVPDPVADERINLGVLVFGDGRIRGKFLRNWKRIESFGLEDASFLREFVTRARDWSSESMRIPGLAEGVALTETGLREIAGQWMNSIQFSEVRASTLSPEALLDEAGDRFIREPVRKTRTFRDRRSAVSLAVRELDQAARGRRPAARKLIKRYPVVQGMLDSHVFDVGLQNGTLLLAARALSFEGPATKDLDREIDATAWSIDDVRSQDKGLPIAVLALPPRSAVSKNYEKAAHIFRGLGADMIPERDIPRWASEVVTRANVG